MTAGVMFLGGDGGDRPELVAHPDLAELTFPDPGAFRYEEGEAAVCETMGEVMAARGYALFGTNTGNGVSCAFGTPGTSLLEDGSYSLHANIALTRGDGARDAYDNYVTSSLRGRENLADDPSFTFSELYEFPAGEEGFLDQSVSSVGPTGSATAAFRSGDDTFRIVLSGSIRHVGDDNPSEPLTEEITREEIVDIVKALGGDESAGEPRITPVAMEEHPGLPELNEPLLAEGASAEDRCAPVAAVAQGDLGSDVDSIGGGDQATVPITVCSFAMDEVGNDRFGEYGLPHWRVSVTQHDYATAPEGLFPSEEMAHVLQNIMAEPVDRAEEGYEVTLGPLYELPVGESGYLIHSTSNYQATDGSTADVRAGYVIGDSYVEIRVGGGEWGPDGFTSYGEDRLTDALLDVLTAMDA
ncbi:hypothetical protein [Streptomyces litchfieldiae]|uniref:Uncharacterized protein n=1 Tax=Streptomyces litchfieldiae TaxID=3075543 RepID=A0ABU2MZB1_9ACTN|nr:hypothetical protein [Streptomyces sp. DSM 44938]MDT0346982.1 hypothetical protein [Streptomyces sp. DSM 44938]